MLLQYIDQSGSSGTKFLNMYIIVYGLPASFPIYEISEIFIESQINLQDQETNWNPVLNSSLKSDWA